MTQTNIFLQNILLELVIFGIQGKTRIIVHSQKSPNVGGESCTILRLRLMRKLAMSHTESFKDKKETMKFLESPLQKCQ